MKRKREMSSRVSVVHVGVGGNYSYEVEDSFSITEI